MAPNQYSTLMDALQMVPDPRKARGKRYPWTLLLTLIVAALASNYQTARAIAQWARLHLNELRAALPSVTAQILSVQLRQLEADEIVTRTVFAEVPVRVEYELSAYGRTMPLVSCKRSVLKRPS